MNSLTHTKYKDHKTDAILEDIKNELSNLEEQTSVSVEITLDENGQGD